MEAAVKVLYTKKGAFFSLGAFGKRWYEMAIANGKEADITKREEGYSNKAELSDTAAQLKKGCYDFKLLITHSTENFNRCRKSTY